MKNLKNISKVLMTNLFDLGDAFNDNIAILILIIAFAILPLVSFFVALIAPINAIIIMGMFFIIAIKEITITQ